MKYYYCDGLYDDSDQIVPKSEFVLNYRVITNESGEKEKIVVKYPRMKKTLDYSVTLEKNLLAQMHYQARKCGNFPGAVREYSAIRKIIIYAGFAIVLGTSHSVPFTVLALCLETALIGHETWNDARADDAEKNSLFVQLVEPYIDAVDPTTLSKRVRRLAAKEGTININNIDSLYLSDIKQMVKQIERARLHRK